MRGKMKAICVCLLACLLLCRASALGETQYGTVSTEGMSGKVLTAHRSTLAGMEGAFYYTSLYTITGYEGTDERVWVPEYFNGNVVEAIGDNAFAGNTTIKRLHLPLNKSGSVGSGAMRGMTALEYVNIPNNVMWIGENVLADCGPQLREISFIGEIVMSIGEGSFLGNPNVTLIGGGPMVKQYALEHDIPWQEKPELLPDDRFIAEETGDGSLCLFSRATNGSIEYQIIPQNSEGRKITAIGSRAFYGWTKLKSVYIPKSVTDIAEDAFEGIGKLTIHTEYGSYAADFARSHGYELVEDEEPIPESLSYRIDTAWWRVELTGYEGTLTQLTIPKQVMGIPVTIIGSGAFASCESLREVTIPAGISLIRGSAFKNCVNLESVTIETALGTYDWGTGCFSGCSSLKQVSIAPGTKIIPERTFFGCSSLSSLFVPSSVSAVGGGAFAGCTSLDTLTFEDAQRWSIEDGLGYVGSDLMFVLPERISERVVIREGTRSIYQHAFMDCDRMTELVIPGSMVSIDASMTNIQNTDLKTLELCEGVQKLKTLNSYSIERLILPVSLEEIEYLALRGDPSKRYVIAREGSYAYRYAEENGINVIDPSMLEQLDGMQAADGLLYAPLNSEQVAITGYEGDMPDVIIPAEIDGMAVVEIASEAFRDNLTVTSVMLPEGVVRIGESAFYGCEELQSVELPASLEEIGQQAFACCYELKAMAIPDNVTSIPNNIFMACFELQELRLPGKLEEIGFGIVQNCGKIQIQIPASVREIDGGAFIGSEVQVSFAQGSPFVEEDGIVYDALHTKIVTCLPTGYRKTLVIADGIREIGSDAFGCNDVIERVVIPGSVQTVGVRAFSGATKLKEIWIMEGVGETGINAFFQCTELELLVLPESLTRIDLPKKGTRYMPEDFTIVVKKGSFAETKAREAGWTVIYEEENTRQMPQTVESVIDEEGAGSDLLYDLNADGALAIYGYRGTSSSLRIPGEIGGVPVRCISEEAFADETGITEVYIEDGVCQIDPTAFWGCSNVTSLRLPEGLEVLGAGIFESMPLEEVTLPSTLREISVYAFSENLRALTLPAGVERITGGTWRQSDVRLEEGSKLHLIEGIFYDETQTTLMSAMVPSVGAKVTVLATVETVEYGALSFCNALEEIIFPESVTSVGSYALANCASLRRVEFQEGLKSTGKSPFWNCKNLEELVLPASLEKVDLSMARDGTVPEGLVVIAPEGSYAQQAAIEAGIPTRAR